MSIVFSRTEFPQGVFSEGQNAPIRTNQFISEFAIKLERSGCFAIDVKLVEDDPEVLTFGFDQDEVFGANTSGTRQCYCFEAGKPRKFWITGSAPAHRGHKDLKAENDGEELPPLVGNWAHESGLEVRVEVKVYMCSQGKCEGDKGCKQVSSSKLSDLEIEDEGETSETDIEVYDGGEPWHLIPPLIKAGSAAGSVLMGKAETDEPTGPSPEGAQLAKRLKKTQKELRRLKRKVNRKG